ncbi:MAG: NAD(+)/NADH kinase [Clostridia bacterium]|nr:NAD(+)/NADH kinase [Clostridia bacterium]
MKKIAILPNSDKDTGLEKTKYVIECLSEKAELYMLKVHEFNTESVCFVDECDIYSMVDYAIVLGGDGTIIQCATECAKNNIPVMGINMGTVGFLTEVEIDDISEAVNKLLNDDFETEKRMMLCTEIIKDSKTVSVHHALNDVVISKTIDEKLINIGLYTNNELVNSYNADGLIIATPTGSTGYSISAGGPVADPLMQLYIATPICAHMLSARSAILSAEKEIIIKIGNNRADTDAVVTTDGDIRGYINSADEIRISKSEFEFELIKTVKQSFYETLLSKLI